jgi:hypothetical protein
MERDSGWRTVAEMLEHRAAADAATREALAAYPDLILAGGQLASPSLRTEDCDRLFCFELHGTMRVTLGKQVGSVVVLRWGFRDRNLAKWLGEQRERRPELYGQLVEALGSGS